MKHRSQDFFLKMKNPLLMIIFSQCDKVWTFGKSDAYGWYAQENSKKHKTIEKKKGEGGGGEEENRGVGPGFF